MDYTLYKKTSKGFEFILQSPNHKAILEIKDNYEKEEELICEERTYNSKRLADDVSFEEIINDDLLDLGNSYPECYDLLLNFSMPEEFGPVKREKAEYFIFIKDLEEPKDNAMSHFNQLGESLLQTAVL